MSSSVKWRKQYRSCRVAGDDQLMLIWRKDHSLLEGRPGAPLMLLGVPPPPRLGTLEPTLRTNGGGIGAGSQEAHFWNDSAIASFLESSAWWVSLQKPLLVWVGGEAQEGPEVPANAGCVQPGYLEKNSGQISINSFFESHTGGQLEGQGRGNYHWWAPYHVARVLCTICNSYQKRTYIYI